MRGRRRTGSQGRFIAAARPRSRARRAARPAASPISPRRSRARPGARNVPRPTAVENADAAVLAARVLLDARPRRHRRAAAPPVKMRTASPGPTCPPNAAAGRRLADQREVGRCRVGQIRGAHRIAVHRRDRDRRLVARRVQIVGEHAAERLRRARPTRSAAAGSAARMRASASSTGSMSGAGP